MIGRTLLSIFFIRKSLFFLAHKAAIISGKLTSRVLAQPLLQLQKRTSQETLYALTGGVSALVLNILGAVVILASDLSLVLVLAVGLLVVDTATAIGSFIFFALIAIFLYAISWNSTISRATLVFFSIYFYFKLFYAPLGYHRIAYRFLQILVDLEIFTTAGTRIFLIEYVQ